LIFFKIFILVLSISPHSSDVLTFPAFLKSTAALQTKKDLFVVSVGSRNTYGWSQKVSYFIGFHKM